MATRKRYESPIPGYMTYHEAAEHLGLQFSTLQQRYASYGLQPASFTLIGRHRIALFSSEEVERVRQERAGAV